MQLPHPYVPPMWRESRIGFELAGLMRSGVWHGDGVAAGDNLPVLLVSGLLAGDQSLNLMAGWLKRTGHRPCRAGIASNVDCSQRAAERLERRLECLAEETGQKVAIIGQSRGGVLARVVAYRRPDLVSGIVTLGAPTVSMLKVHPLVLLNVGLVGALGTGRVPGLMSLSCLRGACCKSFRTDLPAQFPTGVGYVSAYSRSDGIVDWHACLDPAAEHVQVHASHCGMAVSEQVYRLLAGALAEFGGEHSLPLAA
jgi:pimeloyl-ACP methyl ester carboxylesterase